MNSSDLILKKYPIPEIDEDISKSSFDVVISKYTAQPLSSIGFNRYLHQSYELFNNALNKQETKTFYWVVNGFEVILNDQDRKNELLNNIKLFLDIKDTKLITNDSKFLEFWEIMIIYKLFNKSPKISINSKSKDQIELVLENYFEKIISKADKFTLDDKSYDLKIIDNDSSMNNKNDESQNFITILNNVYKSFDSLKADGSLIIKIGDIFTTPTVKLIILLKYLFKNVSIYKPYYSRPCWSDKYLICTGFNDINYKKINKKLEKCVNLINSAKDNFVLDFMSDFDAPKQILSVLTYINILLSGIQHREKNKIMKYIESQNYFGQEYQDYVARQLSCTEYFLSNFFPIDKNDFIAIQKRLTESSNKNIENMKEYKNSKEIRI